MNYDKMTKEQVIGLLKDALEYIGKQEDRINKAIEYIESYIPNYDFDKTNLIKLLEILKGSDKE